MANTEKIFVDLDEEVNFVLERVASSSAPKVILIVPKGSNLASSLISLKVLSKGLASSDKTVVLATEDELGTRLADKSRIVTVTNPGEINPEIWEKAQELKEEITAELDRKKHLLLERRNEKSGSDYKIVDEESPKEIKLNEPKVEESKEEEIKPLRVQNRIPAKSVTIGMVKFLSAGDVLQDEQLLNELIPKKEEPIKQEADSSEIQTVELEADSNQQEEVAEKKSENPADKQISIKRKRIIGNDYSAVLPTRRVTRGSGPRSNSENGVTQTFQNLKEQITQTFNNILDTPRKKKLAVYGLGLVVIFFLFNIFFSSSATITVTLKKDTLSINEQIKASPLVQGINIETFEIPAEVRSSEDSASEGGEATGTGTKGDKAEGVITLFNSTTQDIKVPAGTNVTIITSQLTYVTTSEVTVPAFGSTTTSPPDVGIVASEPGDKYNSSTPKEFTVGSYPTSQLIGKTLSRPIQGGTSKQVVVVSQEDIDSVKEIVKTRVESTAVAKLESLASSDEILLKETITAEILEESVSKKAGDESESFDVTIRAKVNALFVRKTDIESIAKQIAKQKQAIEGESEINIAAFPQITNITFVDGIATFGITSQANARAKIEESSIEDEVQGKSIGEAEDYLNSVSDIESYKIDYSPSFLPSFLKRIPSEDRVQVKITK